MKLQVFLISMFCIIANSAYSQNQSNTNSFKAKQLIEKVIAKTGNYELLKQLKDVEFEYTFLNPNNNKKDVSIERYIFNGEVSWGKYSQHEVFVFPTQKDTVTQYFDGKSTIKVTSGTTPITESKVLKSFEFLRKANFYWFTMIPKLVDPGVIYELLPDRAYKGIHYKIVKIGFENGVGEVQDDFVLYINPTTLLIDQFLFTVKGSGLGISMMEIAYKTVNGYTFMAKRKVITGAAWDGTVKGPVLFIQTTENVRFNNDFTKQQLIEEM